ncbi:MAG TPA: O-antigen ligase family protein [Solirubrobacteraceae bacterium]|jgi:O-antigen ligase
MGVATRTGSRNPIFIAVTAALCVGVGAAAGASPKLGLEVTIGLVFVVIVVANLLVGVVLFTVLSFLEVINSGGAALSFMKVAGLVLFVSWYAASATRGGRETRSLITAQPALTVALVALVSWSLISVVWAESRGTAIASTERYLLNILLLPIVFGAIRRREHFYWIVGAFIFGADISAIYGFLASGGGRLSGAIGDPNQLAQVLIAALLLSLPLISASPPGSARRFAAISGAGIAAVGVLYTDSRGGLIALGCTLLAGIFVGGRWRYRALLLLVVSACGFGLYVSVIAPLSAREHLSSSDTSGRADLWKIGLRMFSANPITGVGSGNFQFSSIHYLQKAGPLTRADEIVGSNRVTHNTYLEVADELGLPGLIALLAVVAFAIGAALRAAHRYESAGDVQFEMMSRALILAIVAFLVADVLLSGQYYKQLWLLLALAPPLLALAPPADA